MSSSSTNVASWSGTMEPQLATHLMEIPLKIIIHLHEKLHVLTVQTQNGAMFFII